MQYYFKLMTMSWPTQEKDGTALTCLNGCPNTSQLVSSFEKNTLIDRLCLSSLKIDDGKISVKTSECNKGIVHFDTHLFYQ